MRDIEFRGIDIKTGEMVFGGGIDSQRDTPIIINHGERYLVDAKTVGQYTGLKDKNGVEIYEGDIISQHTEWNDTTYFEGGYSSSDSCETETVGVVKIYPSKGVVITRCKKLDIIACDGKWEKAWDCNVRSCRATVIGNIHQNPELLGD